MSRYEVEVQVVASVWVDVYDAASEEEAEEEARQTFSLGDAQVVQVVGCSVMKYAEAGEVPL